MRCQQAGGLWRAPHPAPVVTRQNKGKSMPTISCPDCGTEVQDDIPACPNCGSPIRAAQYAKFVAGAEMLFAQGITARDANNPTEALRLFRKVVDNFHGTYSASGAQNEIQKLTNKINTEGSDALSITRRSEWSTAFIALGVVGLVLAAWGIYMAAGGSSDSERPLLAFEAIRFCGAHALRSQRSQTFYLRG
jgi:zinc-ribbon domain